MVKYSIVAKDECIACGTCGSVAPDIFDFDDDGHSENIYDGDANTGSVEISEELHDDLIYAAEECPTEAIKVSDTPFS